MLKHNLQRHLSLAPLIDSICQPLQNYLEINSFVYLKNFDDGASVHLTNQPAWLEHYHAHELYKLSGFEKHPEYYCTSQIVWSYLSHHQPILTAAREFNIAHGFTLIKKASDGCEFYFFGTSPDNSHCLNRYLNNQHLFEQFILYFKEQASPLLWQINQHKVFIPDKYPHNTSRECGIPLQAATLQKDFLQATEIKKFYISPGVYLTPRELACAQALLQGNTARGIAAALFISPRTVESHIDHLKDKLDCRTRSALIAKMTALKLHALHSASR